MKMKILLGGDYIIGCYTGYVHKMTEWKVTLVRKWRKVLPNVKDTILMESNMEKLKYQK
jgi:uncharacterized membrane protein SirB2